MMYQHTKFDWKTQQFRKYDFLKIPTQWTVKFSIATWSLHVMIHQLTKFGTKMFNNLEENDGTVNYWGFNLEDNNSNSLKDITFISDISWSQKVQKTREGQTFCEDLKTEDLDLVVLSSMNCIMGGIVASCSISWSRHTMSTLSPELDDWLIDCGPANRNDYLGTDWKTRQNIHT